MKTLLTTLRHWGHNIWTFVVKILTAFPLATFIVLLFLVIGSLVAMTKLQAPAQAPEETKMVKSVHVAAVGEQPKVTVQAKVDKAGVIQIVAQTSGVVQHYKLTEGQTVKNGQNLLKLSSNYQGANSATVGRQIAQKNYQFVQDTYDQQKQVIDLNRRLAQTGEAQAVDLRKITRQSVEDTKSLISLNEEVIEGFDDQLVILESTNVGGINDPVILELKAGKSQILGALTSLRAAQRANEYMGSDNEEPAELARLSRDATVKQLEIQEKSLDLNKDLAALNVKLARITESLFFPTAPCGGVIQRIHVKPGQVVNPGQVLVTLTTEHNPTTIVAYVPGEVARSVVPFSQVPLTAGSMSTTAEVRHISQEPTEHGLHTILMNIPESMAMMVSNESFVTAELPVGGHIWKTSDHAYIPLDAVYQSQDQALVYVAKKHDQTWQAATQVVKLGSVVGNFVQVTEGLHHGDQVILDRTVAAGDDLELISESSHQ